jgi:Trk K+ transport system NAD-binding subunit
MKNNKFKERLNYKFDSIMSKGTISLVVMLFLITAAVVIVAGTIAFLIDGVSDASISKTIWVSLMHAIDAGTLAGDDGNVVYIILMSVVTICGIFITSMLIGIINTGLEAKMAALRKGTSKVLEKDHVVIIGFDDNIYSLLSELIIANENKKKPAIVVLGNEEKEFMEDQIKAYLPDTKNTRIICRSGQTSSPASLAKCSIESCSSVIINEKEDFSIIKAILSVVNVLKAEKAVDCKAHITATINDERNVNVAKIAGEGRAEILYFNNALSRIIAHTCRQPGISSVFTELFDFGGDEIYIEEIDGLYGKTFAEIICCFEKSSVIGLKKKGAVTLNPKMDTLYEKGDAIILIAEDDNVSFPIKTAPKFELSSIVNQSSKKMDKKEKMLLLGYNELLAGMLEELDHYVDYGSEVTVATVDDSASEELSKLELKNIKLSVQITDIYDIDILQNYALDGYEYIILFSDSCCDSDEADSKTLLLLLYLREISEKNNCKFSITSEMRQIRHQELAKAARVNDFVVGSNITGLLTTQISQNRQLHSIFEDLLDDDGSEIYMKPASDFVTVNKPVNLFTAFHAATLKNEVMIGYKKFSGNADSFEIVLNPNKNNVVTFTEKDLFITIAEE